MWVAQQVLLGNQLSSLVGSLQLEVQLVSRRGMKSTPTATKALKKEYNYESNNEKLNESKSN